MAPGRRAAALAALLLLLGLFLASLSSSPAFSASQPPPAPAVAPPPPAPPAAAAPGPAPPAPAPAALAGEREQELGALRAQVQALRAQLAPARGPPEPRPGATTTEHGTQYDKNDFSSETLYRRMPSFIEPTGEPVEWTCDSERPFKVGGPQKSGTSLFFALVVEAVRAHCLLEDDCTLEAEGQPDPTFTTDSTFAVDTTRAHGLFRPMSHASSSPSSCVWRFTDHDKHDYRRTPAAYQQQMFILRDIRDRVVSRFFYSGLVLEGGLIPSDFAKDWTKRMLLETLDIYLKYQSSVKLRRRREAKGGGPRVTRGVGGPVYLVLFESLALDKPFEVRRLCNDLGLFASDRVVEQVLARTSLPAMQRAELEGGAPPADPATSRLHIRAGEVGSHRTYIDAETVAWMTRLLRDRLPAPLTAAWLDGGDPREAYQ